MKKYLKALLAMLVLLLFLFSISADERPPYDIILVVDKSLSMEEEIGVVKDFVRDSIIDRNIQIGDNLVIIAFYGQAEKIASFPINAQADITKAKEILATINLNKLHTHTDIGNALDLARAEVTKLGSTDRNKVILMVTDGIQEAPPGSKYFSPDGKFSHELLAKATTIAKEGWKIQVINIGSSPLTKEFTERISGQYTEVSVEPTGEELAQATAELLGTIAISKLPEQLVVPQNRLLDLRLTLKSQGFKKAPQVKVKEIRLTSSLTKEYNVLNEEVTISLPPVGEAETVFKIFIPPVLSEGNYPSDLQFIFGEGAVFSPGIITLNIHINSFFENYPWLLVLIIIGAALVLVLLILLLVKLISSRGIRFRLKVIEQPLKPGTDTFKVRYGSWLYLNESYGRLALVPKRTLRSIGRVYGQKGGLEFEVLREDQFVGLKTGRQNIAGKTITIRTQDGQLLHAEFIRL